MRLSEATVVQAGADLSRSAGLDALSLRALASDLNVTPMALYRHVRDAESLVHAVVTFLLAGMPTDVAEESAPAAARRWAVEARLVLARAPGLAHFVLRNWPDLPPVLRSLEALGQAFASGGLVGRDAVAASNAVFTYVLMRVEAEEAVKSAPARTLDALGEMKHEVPFLWRNRAEYRAPRFDRHFRYGLDAVLRGIEFASA